MTLLDNQVSGASISKYTYIYDALGRRHDRTQTGSAVNRASTDTFSYNDRNEVTGSLNSIKTAAEWNPTYSYDKIGNRKRSTGVFEANYTSNEFNQYSAITAPSAVNNPTYDVDGNLTSDGGNWIYTWNSENRLKSATNDTTTLNFTYDYQGRLVRKDDGTDIEIYLYDGWNRIFAISNPEPQIETTKSFLWGLDLSGSLQGAGGVGGLLKEGDLYPTFDANGNILQKLNSGGAVVMSVDYDPFGNIIEGMLVGDYGFSSKPLIENLNWYYYGFRYYDPVTGRWPSRDPITELGFYRGLFGDDPIDPESEKQLEGWYYSGNLYSFIDNDPVGYLDYLGLAKPLQPIKITDLITKPTKIGGYEKGYTKSSYYCVDSSGNWLPCPGDVRGRNFEDLKKHCEEKCDTKHCQLTQYYGVYRPELGDYARWNWTVGCNAECGAPQGNPQTGKY